MKQKKKLKFASSFTSPEKNNYYYFFYFVICEAKIYERSRLYYSHTTLTRGIRRAGATGNRSRGRGT
jgi:hypothetical protein